MQKSQQTNDAIRSDLLTIRPTFAKIPVVMKAGASEAYRFHIEGKALTLQQVRNARGVNVAQAATEVHSRGMKPDSRSRRVRN